MTETPAFNSEHLNVVLSFHQSDQQAARILLEILLSLSEGIDTHYYLHYSDAPSSLKIQKTVTRFCEQKTATLSTIRSLPPSSSNVSQNVVEALKATSFTQTNEALQNTLVFLDALSQLDHFLFLDTSCVVLRQGWAKPLYEAFQYRRYPIVGSKCRIDGTTNPSGFQQFSICALYDCLQLQSLALPSVLMNAEHPIWQHFPYSAIASTPQHNFVSDTIAVRPTAIHHVLWALYFQTITDSFDPADWPIEALVQDEPLMYDVTLTDWTFQDLTDRLYGKVSILCGINNEEAQQAVLRRVRSPHPVPPSYPLGGRFNAPPLDSQAPLAVSSPSANSGSCIRPDNSAHVTLAGLRNQFVGQRCFIIGNGPSLAKTDLTYLKHEFTIGLNRIYLNYPNMGFEPTFYCCVNQNVIEQFAGEIDRLNSIKFVSTHAENLLKNRWNTFFMESVPRVGFNRNLNDSRWHEGWTVTYCAMQVAFHLGFQDVILVGVDHYFKDSGDANQAVTATQDDVNHFHPDYFGKGVVWQYPDLERSEESYRLAKQQFERQGRKILDATIDGHLNIFPKFSYAQLVSETMCIQDNPSPAPKPVSSELSQPMQEPLKTIIYYPILETQADLDDCLSRAAWYLFPYLDQIESIIVPVGQDFKGEIEVSEQMDGAIAHRLPALLQKVNRVDYHHKTLDLLRTEIEYDADILLIWKMPEEEREKKALQRTLNRLGKTRQHYRVDRNQERMEGSFYLWIGEQSFPDDGALLEESKQAFARFSKTLQFKKGYVFGTGPSLSMARELDFSDGDSIVCNSIVKNRELLHHIRPKALAAGDPIFHAGCSQYAAQFRQELIEVLREFDLFLFVPMRDYRLYRSFLEPELQSRVVGVPYDAAAPFNANLMRDFYVSPTANILTLLLLPISATFHDEIWVLGCDGRPLSEDSSFWKHDPASQFSDKMANIKTVHPGFFNLDYNDYYLEHCDMLEASLQVIEAEGANVRGLTPSYMPPLAKRGAPNPDPRPQYTCVVSINPDAVDAVGHFLSYDELLHETFQQVNVPFLSLCNQDMDEELRGQHPFVRPLLKTHSWTVGNRPRSAGEPSDEVKAAQVEELRQAIATIAAEQPNAELVFYMYCGSLNHAEQVLTVLAGHPHRRAVMTLFWLAFADIWEDEFLERWGEVLAACDRSTNIALTVTTYEQQDEFYRRTGYCLPVLPHPSTTISDAAFFKLKAQAVSAGITIPHPFTVLFPGNPLKEKGYELTFNTVQQLSHHSSGDRPSLPLRCVVRHANPGKSNLSEPGKIEQIKQYAQVVQGSLERAEFIELIQSSHIIVLPYTPEAFAKRTSGLLIDAIYCGVPVVVLAGTWLGNLVAKWGCGVVVAEPEAGAIANAVLAIAADYPRYRQAALRASTEFFQSNNWMSLTSSILGLVPGATAAGDRASALLSNRMIGPFSRADQVRFDETRLVADWMADQPQGSIMVDVGAHHGSSLSRFLGRQWRIFAFEPDPDNRQKLLQRVQGNALVTVDSRAVSDRPGETVPFYASQESTGISGLSAFQESHQQRCEVLTTTVAQICEEHDLQRIDFLKIDTEGYDLMVLKGVPWDRVKPSMIECEFEDHKTIPLGYTFKDLAQFLVDQGYTVLVSEWHPIVRYGIQHDWCRLVPYPCTLLSPDAWGNLIAFREPPDLQKVWAIARRQIQPATPATAIQAAAQTSKSPGSSTAQVRPAAKPAKSPAPSQPPAKEAMSPEPPPSSQPESASTRLAASLLKRIARYYSRWPLGVAGLAALLNMLAMIDSPYQWILSGSGTTLLLFLIGHAASKADVSLESTNQFQEKIDQAEAAALRADRKVATALKQGSEAHKQADSSLEMAHAAQTAAKLALETVQRSATHSQKALETINQASGTAEFALEMAKRSQQTAKSALDQVSRGEGEGEGEVTLREEPGVHRPNFQEPASTLD